MRTFMVGHAMSVADLNLWALITANQQVFTANKQHFPHVERLYSFLAGEPVLAELAKQFVVDTAAVGFLSWQIFFVFVDLSNSVAFSLRLSGSLS
jgi:glutathione S-transferase